HLGSSLLTPYQARVRTSAAAQLVRQRAGGFMLGSGSGLPQLAARQGPLVHLVGAVGEAERAGAGPQVRQREVLADAAAAVRLDGPVDHPLRHRRGADLEPLDL